MGRTAELARVPVQAGSVPGRGGRRQAARVLCAGGARGPAASPRGMAAGGGVRALRALGPRRPGEHREAPDPGGRLGAAVRGDRRRLGRGVDRPRAAGRARRVCLSGAPRLHVPARRPRGGAGGPPAAAHPRVRLQHRPRVLRREGHAALGAHPGRAARHARAGPADVLRAPRGSAGGVGPLGGARRVHAAPRGGLRPRARAGQTPGRLQRAVLLGPRQLAAGRLPPAARPPVPDRAAGRRGARALRPRREAPPRHPPGPGGEGPRDLERDVRRVPGAGPPEGPRRGPRRLPGHPVDSARGGLPGRVRLQEPSGS
mmetsp:Transcript_106371/g.317939  ORF Transcript_106371/g.317939 Transcript_106371/m.317939 type:complete len:315 (-) Transcript_106371:191-1135(-)